MRPWNNGFVFERMLIYTIKPMEHQAPRRPWLSRASLSLDGTPIVKSDFYTFLLRTRHLSDDEADEIFDEARQCILTVEELLGSFRRLERLIRSTDGDDIEQLKCQHEKLIAVAFSILPKLHHPRFGRFLPKTRRRMQRQIRYRILKYSFDQSSMSTFSDDRVECSSKLSRSPASRAKSNDYRVAPFSQIDQFGGFAADSWTSLQDRLTKIEKVISANGK